MTFIEKTLDINRSGTLILICFWPQRATRLIGEADHPDSSLSSQNLFIFSDLASMVVFYFPLIGTGNLDFLWVESKPMLFGLDDGDSVMNFINGSFPDVLQPSGRYWPTPWEEDSAVCSCLNLKERVP